MIVPPPLADAVVVEIVPPSSECCWGSTTMESSGALLLPLLSPGGRPQPTNNAELSARMAKAIVLCVTRDQPPGRIILSRCAPHVKVLALVPVSTGSREALLSVFRSCPEPTVALCQLLQHCHFPL